PNSPVTADMKTRRPSAMTAFKHKTLRRGISPPPCGEGKGWGSGGGAKASRLSDYLATPLPSPPHKGGGSGQKRSKYSFCSQAVTSPIVSPPASAVKRA